MFLSLSFPQSSHLRRICSLWAHHATRQSWDKLCKSSSFCIKEARLGSFYFFVCFIIHWLFSFELATITRLGADDKVANFGWLCVFKMHYIPLRWLAFYQLYWTFFMMTFLDTCWLCLAGLQFVAHFRTEAKVYQIYLRILRHFESKWKIMISAIPVNSDDRSIEFYKQT